METGAERRIRRGPSTNGRSAPVKARKTRNGDSFLAALVLSCFLHTLIIGAIFLMPAQKRPPEKVVELLAISLQSSPCPIGGGGEAEEVPVTPPIEPPTVTKTETKTDKAKPEPKIKDDNFIIPDEPIKPVKPKPATKGQEASVAAHSVPDKSKGGGVGKPGEGNPGDSKDAVSIDGTGGGDPYFNALIASITRAWQYSESDLPGKKYENIRTEIVITIDKNGRVGPVEFGKKSNLVSFDMKAMSAVLGVKNLGPLPAKLGSRPISVKIVFKPQKEKTR